MAVLTKHCNIPQAVRWTSHTAGARGASYPSVFLDAGLELNTTVVLSGAAMSYRLVESEKTKSRWFILGLFNGTNHVIYNHHGNCSVWLPPLLSQPLFCSSSSSLFESSSLSYSLRITPCPPLLPFSQGNQCEPVTVCEQRHYSGDSVCPVKHKKNLETAELIESGRAKVSVSSRTERRRGCG